MTTFILVHGAWHGAWCWERLVPELQARGHAAVAVDLPIDDPRRTLPAELGVTPAELPGGHSPFLSRPAALADTLLAGR